MHAATCDLLHFLTSQKAEVFDLSGRVDHRRYLGRGFPLELPLLVHVQTYPGYRSMVGEN